MKNKISLLFLISSLNLFSQTSKAEIINFELIVEAMNPILSDFIIKEKPNSNYLLKEYGFESMYGEFKIKESPNRIDTLSYNEKGVLKYEKVNSDFNFNNDGFRSRNELYFEYPSKIGEKGELINQPNIKYKYNSKGQIIDLIGYLIDGSEIKEHYSFIYNEKNQITEIQHYWGNSKTINDISDYTYIGKGNENSYTFGILNPKSTSLKNIIFSTKNNIDFNQLQDFALLVMSICI